jgi:hypothetical protein
MPVEVIRECIKVVQMSPNSTFDLHRAIRQKYGLDSKDILAEE